MSIPTAPTILLVLTLVLMTGVVLGSLIAWRWVARKEDALWDASRVDGAILREKVMVRDGCVECPGVAVVTNDTLILHSVLKGERRIPLSQITLTKEAASFGWYPWWGKRVLHLKAPGTFRLAIGVKNPEPWQNLFRRVIAGSWRG